MVQTCLYLFGHVCDWCAENTTVIIQNTYKTIVAIPGSPYRGQNWKIGKMTFLGSKNAFWGVLLGTI